MLDAAVQLVTSPPKPSLLGRRSVSPLPYGLGYAPNDTLVLIFNCDRGGVVRLAPNNTIIQHRDISWTLWPTQGARWSVPSARLWAVWAWDDAPSAPHTIPAVLQLRACLCGLRMLTGQGRGALAGQPSDHRGAS